MFGSTQAELAAHGADGGDRGDAAAMISHYSVITI